MTNFVTILDWFQASGKTIKTSKEKVTTPAFSLTDFFEGRQNEKKHTKYFLNILCLVQPRRQYAIYALKKLRQTMGQQK